MAAKKQKQNRVGKFLSRIIFLGIGVMIVGYTITYMRIEKDVTAERQEFEKAFLGDIEEYLAIQSENIQEEPFRTGKILILNPGKDHNGLWIHGLHYTLPEEMQAQSPEEVETVIVAEYQREVYLDATHDSSHIWNAYFRIIDADSRQVIFRGYIEGEPPPGEDQMSEGPIPSYELSDFIESLPEREI